MDRNELIKATLDSGINPIDINLIGVNSTSTRKVIAYRTVMHLNTQQLGVLTPAEYEYVASRTVQSIKLALSNITAISDIIETAAERGIKLEWLSAACPVRMLTKGSASKLLQELFEEVEFSEPSKLCLEFPSAILFEDSKTVSRELSALRFMGIKTAVSGFGDEFCPIMRLQSFPFDYVILDRSIATLMEDDEMAKGAEALTSLVRGLGIGVIADGAAGNEIISRFYQADCSAYIPRPDVLLDIDTALPDRKGY